MNPYLRLSPSHRAEAERRLSRDWFRPSLRCRTGSLVLVRPELFVGWGVSPPARLVADTTKLGHAAPASDKPAPSHRQWSGYLVAPSGEPRAPSGLPQNPRFRTTSWRWSSEAGADQE